MNTPEELLIGLLKNLYPQYHIYITPSEDLIGRRNIVVGNDDYEITTQIDGSDLETLYSVFFLFKTVRERIDDADAVTSRYKKTVKQSLAVDMLLFLLTGVIIGAVKQNLDFTNLWINFLAIAPAVLLLLSILNQSLALMEKAKKP